MFHYPLTGADESTTILLEFPHSVPSGKYKSQAVALTHLRVGNNPDGKWSAGPSIRIYGTKAELQVFGYPYRPEKFRIIPRKVEGQPDPEITEVVADFPANGHGMYWEADEVARRLRDGKLESDTMPWEESLVIMQVMDEVRRQGGLTYPENIESTQYPLQL